MRKLAIALAMLAALPAEAANFVTYDFVHNNPLTSGPAKSFNYGEYIFSSNSLVNLTWGGYGVPGVDVDTVGLTVKRKDGSAFDLGGLYAYTGAVLVGGTADFTEVGIENVTGNELVVVEGLNHGYNTLGSSSCDYATHTCTSIKNVTSVSFDTLPGFTLQNIQLSTTAAPVPEPETYALMLAGVALVGVAARRRSRQLRG